MTGFDTEAKIARSRQTRTVCGGGNAVRLEADIIEALGNRITGMISFGVAGGLSPDLKIGTVILATSILSRNGLYQTDPVWRDRLASKLPKAIHATILGVNSPAAEARQKAQLSAETGAAVVDMESHIAARLAASRGYPFAALRVVLDPVQMTLPPAALAGLKEDGKVDSAAVLRALANGPWQLPALILTAIAASRALAILRHSRSLLDPCFCFPQ